MNNYDKTLIPIALIIMGILSLSGIETFGAAALEAAAWKQNIIYMIVILFLMLPPSVQEYRFVWLVTGGLLGLLIGFGFSNIKGVVGKSLLYGKILLVLLSLAMLYRMWMEKCKTNKAYIIPPILLLVATLLIFPIQDENIIGSSFRALKEFSMERYSSDHGFHIYLGLVSIFAGISEFLIRRKSEE